MTVVGVISVQRHPPDFKNWMLHHVYSGVTKFYISVEDTPGLGNEMVLYATELSSIFGTSVIVHYEDAPAVDRSIENNFTDILDRQSKWTDRMITKARSDGTEWVFHIDDDELAYPGNKTMSTWPEILNKVPNSCTSVHLTNYEAFSPENPTSSWATDAAVRYLPRECGHNFAAYANGKSASRTIHGQRSHGVHHFTGGTECELPEAYGVILHHEALALNADDIPPRRWVEKNMLRGNDDQSTIPFGATREAIRAVQSGDKHLMEKTWVKYRSVLGDNFNACPSPLKIDLPTHKPSQIDPPTHIPQTMSQIRDSLFAQYGHY